MITLYVLDGCPYCHRVLDAFEELRVPHELKRLGDPDVREELIARGGKAQVPYLVDGETGAEMYESEDIVRYLHKRFAGVPVG